VLHDGEDVVHSAELRVLDCLIQRFDLVQLPVLPLIDAPPLRRARRSRSTQIFSRPGADMDSAHPL
jgi:hypothetical protein